MAQRFWVGGGSSNAWNATAPTNWGTASGVQDNASVPTSVDDVIFDGAGAGGNTASTISAIITVKSLTITTGYTSTMTHNAVLTIAGNWTMNNTHTIAGTSALTVSGTTTITSNGQAWPNQLNMEATVTLSGNFTVNGLIAIGGGNRTVNKTTTETLTCAGGFSFTFGGIQAGTVKVIWTGGTFTSGAASYGIGCAEMEIAGNVTFGSNAAFNGTTFTYTSGTVTVPVNNTFTFGGTTTLINVSTIPFENVTFSGGTMTLQSDLTVNKALTISGGNKNVNKTTTEKLVVYGYSCAGGGISGGTIDLYLKGGTWSAASTAYVTGCNLYLDGNSTISGTVPYQGSLIKYVSGTITTTGSNLSVTSGSLSFDTNGMSWQDVSIGTSTTLTLVSNATLNGTYSIGTGLNTTLNKTTAETLTCNGLYLGRNIAGNGTIYLVGGTWSAIGSNGNLNVSLYINGNVTVSGNVYFGGNSSLVYSSGTVTTTGSTLNISSSGVTLNTNGITWNNLSFTATNTTTLTSNLTVNGVLTTGATTTVNRTVAETITIAGGLQHNGSLGGTAEIYLTGGTWNGGGGLNSNIFLNGNISVPGLIVLGAITVKYLSGTVTATSSIVNWQGTVTFDTADVVWGSFSVGVGGGANMTMKNDIVLMGYLSVYKTGSVGFSSSGGVFNITVYGGMNGNNCWMGNANSAFILKGSTFSSNIVSGGQIILDGDVTLTGNNTIQSAVTPITMIYRSGRVDGSTSTIAGNFGATFTNMHKVPIKAATLNNGYTYTFNQMFVGLPNAPCLVTCASNPTIAFTDSFERVGDNVMLAGSFTMSRPLQFVSPITYKMGGSTRLNSSGVRYVNQTPDGFAKNTDPVLSRNLTGNAAKLEADPNFYIL